MHHMSRQHRVTLFLEDTYTLERSVIHTFIPGPMLPEDNDDPPF